MINNFCARCGAALRAGARFCAACGDPVPVMPQPPTSSPANVVAAIPPPPGAQPPVRNVATPPSSAKAKKKMPIGVRVVLGLIAGVAAGAFVFFLLLALSRSTSPSGAAFTPLPVVMTVRPAS